MKLHNVEPKDIYMSDENDYIPQTLLISWDEDYVEGAKKLLADNIWVDKVTISAGVDFEVTGYEGKARGGDITVSKHGGMYFKFFNAWTDTVYTVEL